MDTVELLSGLWKYRARIVLSAVLCGTLAVAYGLLLPRHFSSQVVFVPSANDQGLGAFSAIAAQIGGSIGIRGSQQPPEFYRDVIGAKGILREVVREPVVVDEAGGTMPFNVFAGIDDADSAFAEEEAIKWLSDHFERSVSRETGLVSARVTTESSVGSRYLAQALFGKLETLLVQMRSEEARREREFADRQLLDARERLESAERRLTDFAVANRMYAESPALRAQFETIQRDVSFNEQVVRGLLTAREDASLKEARRSSGLSVVERPVIAGRADRRFLLIRGFVGAIVGGAGAAVLLSLLLVAASDHRLHWVELAVAKVLRL